MTDSNLQLSSLNLVVQDLDATADFYRLLGVEIADENIWRTSTGAHHLDLKLPGGFGLDFDSPALAKVYNAGFREQPRTGGGVVIGFRVESRETVDEKYSLLTNAGYQGAQAPYDTFWGARYAIVEDPDGNHIGIMSPSDPARRSAPPDI